MDLLLIFTVSLVPAALWVWFFYRQDRRDKEPIRLILAAFFAGMIAVVPAAFLEWPFRGLLINPPNLLIRLIVAVGVVGLVEEGAKLAATYLVAYRRPEFNQAVDGIIYAVTASLGFAALENAFYTAAFGYGVAPLRALITTLAHASFGGVAGLYLGLARVGSIGGVGVATGLFIAAVLHGVYDFLIIARLVHPIFAFLLIYLTYRFVAAQIRVLGETPPLR